MMLPGKSDKDGAIIAKSPSKVLTDLQDIDIGSIRPRLLSTFTPFSVVLKRARQGARKTAGGV